MRSLEFSRVISAKKRRSTRSVPVGYARVWVEPARAAAPKKARTRRRGWRCDRSRSELAASTAIANRSSGEHRYEETASGAGAPRAACGEGGEGPSTAPPENSGERRRRAARCRSRRAELAH